MTGTSLDGIDISLVQTNGIDLKRLNKNFYYEYNINTKKKLESILKNDIDFNLNRKNYLDDFVTKEHYLALKNLDILDTCDYIGFHGQTLYHNPINKTSIQLGNPIKLARMLNKKVIFDFRTNDIAFGGQGAPIAPIYHKLIIEKLGIDLPCCFLNIGGISNLTFWDGNTLLGFDTGPGNVLMNDYMSSMFKKNYDKDGKIASKGTPIKEEIKKFLQNSFFIKKPPKSLDREAFLTNYNQMIVKDYSPDDIMATLAEFTVETIKAGFKLLPNKVRNILITGGGCRNIHLMRRIKDKLKVKIIDENQTNINFDFIESELIAYLSARSIYKIPYTFPSTTGVSKPSSGAKLYNCL